MLYRELRDRFIKFNREHPNATPLKGFIVFSAENWPKTYSEKSRTYKVHSDNKAFRPNASSCSLFGSSLDGTDQGVRLDWYMADFGIPGGWAVERCIIEEPVTRVDFTPNDIEAVYDEIDRRIDAEIRDGDFTDEKGEIHMDAVDDCRADMLQGVYSVLMTLPKIGLLFPRCAARRKNSVVISARMVILNDCSGSLVEVCERQFQHQSHGIRTDKHRPSF